MRFFTLGFLVLMKLLPVVAQSYLSCQHFTNNEGLSQSVVNAIYVDKNGKLWVGTQNGLNLFDGYQFRHYKNLHADSMFFTDSYISSIAEDNHENLWIGTRLGINILDEKNFTLQRITSQSFNGLIENWIRGIVCGQTKIFALTDNFITTFKQNSSIPDFFRWRKTFHEYKTNYGITALNDTLIFFNENCLYIYHNQTIDSMVFKQESNGNLLHTTVHEKVKIALLFDRSLRIIDRNLQTIQKFPLSDNPKRLFSAHSSLYILTDVGIYELKNDTLKLCGIFTETIKNLLTVGIRSFTVDRNFNAWIGTEGNGLIKANLKPNLIKAIIPSEILKKQNINNQISTILVHNENILLGVKSFGTIIHGKTTQIADRQDPHVFNLIPFENHILSFGSKGIKLYDAKYRNVELRSVFPYLYPTLSQRLSAYSYQYVDKKLFIATQKGLLMIDPKSRKAEFISEINPYITSNIKYVFSIANLDSVIYLGTISGLVIYNTKNQKIRKVELSENSLRYGSNTIYQLLIDKKQRLWIGTTSGLYRIDSLQNREIVPNRIPSLDNYVIYNLIDDCFGNIWIGTDNGLFHIYVDSDQIHTYFPHQGLPNREFNLGCSHKTNDGTILLGTQGGVAIINPKSMPVDTFNPKLFVSEIEFLRHQGSEKLRYTPSKTIVVAPDVKIINIHFASLDYTNPEMNQYRYRINENNWLELGTQNFISFVNLRPGSYNISINGSNSDHRWSQYYASVLLKVKPPWYQTPWAYIYLMALISLIGFIFNLRLKKLRKINQILREKELVAKEVLRQKESLSILNRNITDSIRYAQRIQRALFPKEYELTQYFSESFILFRAKDFVSGDFFWLHNFGNQRVCIAAVDCTGHGVPGALMSVIGIKLLEEIVIQNQIDHPGDILQQLDLRVMSLFRHHSEEYFLAEGMDLCLTIFDFQKMTVEYAGAINPLYRLRDGAIDEFKADKMPVGISNSPTGYAFETQEIDFRKEDIFYLFTDGYIDQFGGPKGQKYKSSRFKDFLVGLRSINMDMQRAMLENNHDRWKGNNEQIDDILVIGIKI